MKFGKVIALEASHRWTGEYMDYKGLKKVIRTRRSIKTAQAISDAEAKYLYILDREVNKTNRFFEKRLDLYSTRLNQLLTKADADQTFEAINSSTIVSKDQVIAALVQLQRDLAQMNQYVVVNLTAFEKISKKFDKKFRKATQAHFLADLALRPISSQRNVFKDLHARVGERLVGLRAQANQWRASEGSLHPDVRENLLTVLRDMIGRDAVDEMQALLTVTEDKPPHMLSQALMHACEAGRHACIPTLLRHLANPNILYGATEQSALMLAAEKGNVDVVRALLAGHANVDHADANMMRAVHVACINGQPEILELLLKQGASTDVCDNDGLMPMYHAVSRGYADCARLLLEHGATTNSLCVVSDTSGDELPLFVACKHNQSEVLKVLLAHGAGVDAQNQFGETALHTCCLYGSADCIPLLLDAGANIDMRSEFMKRTPIALAVISPSGHGCIDVLLDRGADVSIYDVDRIAPYAHAIYRGLNGIAAKIQAARPKPIHLSLPARSPMVMRRPSGVSRAPTPVALSRAVSETDLKAIDEDASAEDGKAVLRHYGHECLVKPQLSVLLGVDTRMQPLEVMAARAADIDLSMCKMLVRWTGKKQDMVTVDLPITSPTTLSFTVDETEGQAAVQFDIVSRYGGELIARGTLLKPTKDRCYSTVEVPLLDPALEPLAVLRASHTMITPFTHKNMTIGAQTYWRTLKNFPLFGHRGSGAEGVALADGYHKVNVQENTILSFVTAASLGAQYVEFDVQITADNVPVIYHDLLVKESDLDMPLQRLTYDRFLKLRQEKLGVAQPADKGKAGLKRVNSMEIKRKDSERALALSPQKGSDPDTDQVQASKNSFLGLGAPFASLKGAFEMVPITVGFNIEMKVPFREEYEDFRLAETDLNAYVDAVLECVYDHAGSRDIIFSSFNPEVCAMLSLKQSNYPVFMLTESGWVEYNDPRTNSLHEAVRFARQYDLMGIISRSDPLLECPELVSLIKSYGLLVVTWGDKNNIVECVKKQQDMGVDAVIIDHIAHVRKGLVQQQ